MADFSIDIFKKTISNTKNSLVSPLSIMLALAMAANGADGETRSQMENVLGGDISLSDLNEYLYSYVSGLPSLQKSKLDIANSIWFRDTGSLMIVPDFLKITTEYYKASVHGAAFDSQTADDINDWVNLNTDGMIEKIIERISDEAVMILLNAIAFDAEWFSGYEPNDVRKRDFTNYDKTISNIDFMHSTETLYLEDSSATGFIKPYLYSHYSFVALLPKPEINIHDYIATLTGETFINIIKIAQLIEVRASMPKFEFRYSIEINQVLKELGMQLAFSSAANFSKMAYSTAGNIYISQVLHSTYISVDEIGTRAAAVTMVTLENRSATPQFRVVHLDRPYVFAIIDNKTNIPVFIGVILSM